MDHEKPPIEHACDLLGSQSALAALLGVSAPTVNQWVKGSRPVPIEHCLSIEQATDGKVTRQDLRPNDFWKIWPDLRHLAPSDAAPAQPTAKTQSEALEDAAQPVLIVSGDRRHESHLFDPDLDRREPEAIAATAKK